MDRLKFRVWDTKDKCYYNHDKDDEQFICVKNRDGQLLILNKEEDAHFIIAPESYYIIEQCTGLKDKNGKLIYEGDRIRFDGDNSELLGSDIINWQDGDWYLGENSLVYLHYKGKDRLEIIGNIHED